MSKKIFDVKCKECAHCDIENLLCRPNSKDCRELYELTKEDLEKMDRCDFFLKKKEKSEE